MNLKNFSNPTSESWSYQDSQRPSDIGYTNKVLSVGSFRKLRDHIQNHYGIQLPDVKKVMVESRLQKRLKENNIPSFEAYINFVFSHEGAEEYIKMVDTLTTNKTDFFREPSHFDFLTQHFLPQHQKEYTINHPLKMWSAACSSGQEVYSMAICVEEFNRLTRNSVHTQVMGSDISSTMLQKAVSGIYPMASVEELSFSLKKTYFMKSKDAQKALVKVKDHIRHKAVFKRLNLLENTSSEPTDYDIIFCRNALIYFNKEDQLKVVKNLLNHLSQDGFLFIGHSESLSHLLPVKQVGPTIYQKI